MSAKAGQYTNGIPRPDLWESVTMITGGVQTPAYNDKKWQELEAKLKVHTYSGFEFCYWLVNYGSKGLPFAVEILRMSGMVTSDVTWGKFLAFKETYPDRVRVQVHLDKDILHTAIRHRPICEALLSRTLEVSAVIRVEFALQRARLGDFDIQPVLDMWGPHAGEVLMGLPEYLPHAPRIVENMENADVTRFLFPR